jgi:hypothetical protein
MRYLERHAIRGGGFKLAMELDKIWVFGELVLETEHLMPG